AGSLQVVLSCVFWRVGPLAAGKVTRADDELSLLLLRLRRRHRHGKRQHGKLQLLVHGALSSCARAHRPFQAIQLHLSSWILDRVVSPHIILAFFLAARDLPTAQPSRRRGYRFLYRRPQYLRFYPFLPSRITCPRSHRRCGPSRTDLGGPSRLVATAEEDRLNISPKNCCGVVWAYGPPTSSRSLIRLGLRD